MPRSKPSIFARHDTFFGVCEAIGEDFRFNANWLRLAIAVGLLVSPVFTLAAYVGLGLVVLVSRRFFPSHATAEEAAPALPNAPLKGDNDEDRIELATAA